MEDGGPSVTARRVAAYEETAARRERLRSAGFLLAGVDPDGS